MKHQSKLKEELLYALAAVVFITLGFLSAT
jgi:hypothetical protein